MSKAGGSRREEMGERTIAVSDPALMRRSVRGAVIGNFVEFYDFGAFSYLATELAQVFYPGTGVSAVYLIATFGTQAVAFAVRPLGGFVFGALGDRVGRKPVLLITIALMTMGTTATGLLPAYHTLRIWAPILLVVARMLQGFSAGGYSVGAMIYVSEHASDRSRGMMSGFLPLGSRGGYVVAGALTIGLEAWLPTEDMLNWGWRIPLLLSAPLGLVTLFIRRWLGETPAYEREKGNEKASGDGGGRQLRRTVVQQWKPLLICTGLVLTYKVADYLLTGYLPTYFKEAVHVGRIAGMVMIVATLLVVMAAVVFVAKLSDRIGAKRILWTGCGMLVSLSVPAFLLIRYGGSYPVEFIGVLLLGIMVLCFDSTASPTLPALFPTSVRYGAMGIGFNISISAFGGTTPLIAEC